MSKIMTKEPKTVLFGRYDREGCRTRVVIPGYRLVQCVNMTHWPEQSRECLEKALPGHPNLVDLVDGIVGRPGLSEGVKLGNTSELHPELRLVAYSQTQFVVEMRYLISAIYEHSRHLARMLDRFDPLWVKPREEEDISTDLATIMVAEVGCKGDRPIWVTIPCSWEDMSPGGRGLVTPAGVTG